jgi:hypothetical protein
LWNHIDHETIFLSEQEVPQITRRVNMTKPHYYLMKCKKILRLESDESYDALPLSIRDLVFDRSDIICLDQEQANWRVAIFRDEIMDMEEFTEWHKDGVIFLEEEELELVAN